MHNKNNIIDIKGPDTNYQDEATIITAEEDDDEVTPFVMPSSNQLQAESNYYDSNADLLERGSKNKSKEMIKMQKLNLYLSYANGRKCLCFGFLGMILIIWLLWTIIMNRLGPAVEGGFKKADNSKTGNRHIDLPDLYNKSFFVKRPELVWVKNDPRDGIFSYTDPETKDILLKSVETGKSELFVKASDLTIGGNLLTVDSFEISEDGEFLFIKTNVTKLWRYSTRFNIYIYKFADKSLYPLNENTTVNFVPSVAYAAWSPTGHKLAYVQDNNLFITNVGTKATTQVTFDGSSTIFNGIPDWVYEEEVFASDNTLWWAPDSSHIAFIRYNETHVPVYDIPLYTVLNDSYPIQLPIKYPKAGAPNPIVSLLIYSLTSNTTVSVTKNEEILQSSLHTSNSTFSATFSKDSYSHLRESDRIITDIIWATETHSHLLFKQTNRIQTVEYTNLVILGEPISNTVVETIRTYSPTDGGWIDSSQTMVYINRSNDDDDTSSSSHVRYLDIIDDGSGFMHLAILTATSDKKQSPQWITFGKWEVIPGTVTVDNEKQLVHYTSTERSPLERHLYVIDFSSNSSRKTNKKLLKKNKKCLTCPDDPESHGYYEITSFSPKLTYYILQYQGPDVPYTVVKKVDNSTFAFKLEGNENLRSLLEDFDLPRARMVPVKSGGIEMEAMEIVPPDFDVTKKYPVLFHVYGGPGSQLASYRFELSWSTFLASKLGYIIVTVDGRGTGFRGRGYRSNVRGRLGELETIDQINAARHWSMLEYVDPARIAIWGWSYGGYMATKVIEANSGLFAAGLAVAPVTDWRFYDSIYTERYMSTPELNPQGYAQSAVNNMTGFENARYLVIHGTGDDNVHFQNTAVLVDKLTQANIHNFQVHFFTDSNHRISYHNANQNVYHLLTNFLWESFGGEEYLHLRKELNGHFSGPLMVGEH
ncbi:dipeptidyl peptidase IV N-terminal region-domain-containing protein [Mycotypha africana]|uniref:dipeptidyl peptidase IV N-terminal region-domain-containing protein n=1 Tax=Mycotypha africana TaxID=64632 RepID=UPI0022FFEDD1|nr:dipeptidyl peptidase IV N-terminal region-domain-containing protein [Mycotypha africana]KAI8968392.1 dipeptidyl peptidase IV N-terminal region-domain-containing protein [Mycotypha africana]